MKLKIKRIDKDLPLPKRHSDQAAAFDLYSREDLTIEPGEVGYAPLNLIIQTPEDHFFFIAPRGGLHKKGLMLANGVGVGDPDFFGEDDEYHAPLLNFSKNKVEIKRGDRLVQGMFIKTTDWDWVEVDSVEEKSRGKFGSTGQAI